MTEPVDVFWSFRSPYSYLATYDLIQLREDFDVEVNLRVVLPLAIRNKAAVFDPANTKPVRYIMLDWNRRAECLGRPHLWPNPDPVVQEMPSMTVAAEQPYLYRLSYLGVEAQRRGNGLEFAANVSRLLFGGTLDWHEGEHLAEATAAAGLDLADMEKAISQGDHLSEVAANHAALECAGHWGVPTMKVRGEPFFGQDRIETLRWRLARLGLERK